MAEFESILDWIDAMPTRSDVKYRQRKLEHVYELAKQTACGDIVEGTTVALTRAPKIKDKSHGWWCYREALQPGAIGTVVDVDYNLPYQYWSVTVRLDRCWTVHEDGSEVRRFWSGKVAETPEGFIPPYKDQPGGLFTLHVDMLEVVS